MHLIDFMNEDIKKKLIKKTYKKKETILFAEQENEYVIFMIDGIAEAVSYTHLNKDERNNRLAVMPWIYEF